MSHGAITGELRDPVDPYDGKLCSLGCHRWSTEAPEGWVGARQWRPATRRSGPEESDREPVAAKGGQGAAAASERSTGVTAPNRVVDPVTGAVKDDGAKPRTDLLPVRPLLDTAEVFRFGADKYADRNWERGFDWSRPYGALLRHLFLWWSGQDDDEETGLSHLAHAACCLMMLMEYRHTGAGKDDRPGKETD